MLPPVLDSLPVPEGECFLTGFANSEDAAVFKLDAERGLVFSIDVITPSSTTRNCMAPSPPPTRCRISSNLRPFASLRLCDSALFFSCLISVFIPNRRPTATLEIELAIGQVRSDTRGFVVGEP